MKVLFLILLAILPFGMSAAKCNTPAYTRGIHNDKAHQIFANSFMVGYYDVITHNIGITFKQDLDHVEVLIYKDDSICEQDVETFVKKADFKDYLLSAYGTGDYTICIKVDGVVIVSKEIEL